MKGETDMEVKKLSEAEIKEICREAIPHIEALQKLLKEPWKSDI